MTEHQLAPSPFDFCAQAAVDLTPGPPGSKNGYCTAQVAIVKYRVGNTVFVVVMVLQNRWVFENRENWPPSPQWLLYVDQRKGEPISPTCCRLFKSSSRRAKLPLM